MSREYYIAGIPATDSAVEATYKNIETALYNMGMIYKDDLKDYDKAGESFKELIKRFPASAYLLASYYNLYGIAREQNNPAMVDYYKNIIATQFPESMYAKVLTDPEYFKNLEREDQEVRDYYAQTYDFIPGRKLLRSDHPNCQCPKNLPGTQFISPVYIPWRTCRRVKPPTERFSGIISLPLRINFQEPKSRLMPINLINYMDQEHPEIKEAEEVKISQQLYQYAPMSHHLFVFALDKQINTNQFIFNIINYNLDHNDSLNLIVEVINLNPRQNLVLGKNFPQ